QPASDRASSVVTAAKIQKRDTIFFMFLPFRLIRPINRVTQVGYDSATRRETLFCRSDLLVGRRWPREASPAAESVVTPEA
ncbi:MAG: hypothetical protein WA077_16065, partial [Anaerolineae bacterium]